MAAATAHDHEVRYEEREMGVVPGDGFARTATDEGVRVEGRCPRCEGPYAASYRRGFAVVGSKGLFSGNRSGEAPEDPVARAVHICECGHPHPGQPDALPFVGCGAQWRIAGGAP